MKDSGVEWQGATPLHWRKDKLYRLCKKMGSGGTPTSTNEGYYGGNIPWIQSGDLTDSYVFDTKKSITDEALENSSAKIFSKGTLLVAMYGATIGKLGIMEMDAATNQACCSLLPSSKIETKFLYYLMLDARQFLLKEAYGGGQPNISQETLKQLHMVVPQPAEQKAIAKYLDKSCEKIDKTLSIKQQQLDKLEAYRKSVIHEAVTKGLDKNVAMKDSGIDWLGDIPEHWKLDRLNDSISFNPLKSKAQIQPDELVTVLPMESISEDGKILGSKTALFKETDKGLNYFENGDVIFAKITPCMENGKGALIANISTRISVGSTEFFVLRPTHKINAEYLYFLTRNQFFRDFLAKNMKGAAGQQRVPPKVLKSSPLPLPDISEQAEIATYLVRSCEALDKTKSVIKSQISKLTQYRQSLLHECVTGKKRVYQGDIN